MSTPIRRQYLELKGRYPDTILFFRLGDFYETFDDDAVLVAGELHITLTSKPMGKDLRVPLAGVPYHSIDGHVAKLVAKGHRVAICEQMADPEDVKGIVPREVVRVVTAGTVTAENSLAADAPNYLAAIVVRREGPALALADITTGEVQIASGEGASFELLGVQPAEVLFEEDEDLPPGGAWVAQRRAQMHPAAAEAELARQFGEHALTTLVEGPAAAAALAHILAYLRETYPAALGALQRVRPAALAETLIVDANTLRNLDVFPVPGRDGSLFNVLNATRTYMGGRLLRRWLSQPLREAPKLAERHDAVEWAMLHPIEREQLRALLKGMPDIGRLLGKVGARSATPRDLHALRTGLRATLDLGAMLQRAQPAPLIAEGMAQLAAAAEPLLALDAALDPDPPPGFDEGGVIAPGFAPEIDSLRDLTRDARGFLLGLERLERERSGIKSLKVGHNRVFGYYLEVSSANAGMVPAHYQRRQTLVGAERYVTEELKEHESRLVGARDRLVDLERLAFAQLVESVAAHYGALQAVAEAVALIDLVLALGDVAALRGYTRPRFEQGEALEIMGGRHPVVEAALGTGSFVPNDCVLDEGCQVVILTGPNMSGKSTYLRQVALIALMAQAGSFVPAKEARLPLFDRIFTRIGAQDDLAAGQSTFMVEMVETAQILHRATPRSLVILDEVGRGTSTFDGMAIARAVVEFLHNRKEVAARTLFATHYHELTALADVLPRVQNAHVAVREDAGDVVFEHRIVPGPSDRSYGVHVARLAGLPPAVVHRAEQLLIELQDGHAPRPAEAATQQPALFGGPTPTEEAVRALDIEGMTPLEAIQKLYELKALAAPGTRPAMNGVRGIAILPPEVAARIAAGEVIERPVSVVRELLDNAIDAGATHIALEIEDGGVTLIRISDDGRGIPPGDLELAFERHATSKIAGMDDLALVATLGFRGEALPSIAAAADVEILSRAEDEPVGVHAVLVDARVVKRSARPAPVGTTFTVRELFARLPARRKFLASYVAEARQIATLVSHYALAYPGISFQLSNGGRRVLTTAGDGGLRHAFAAVYGANVAPDMLDVCYGEEEIQISGLAGPPSLHRGNRSAVSVFVNGRWVQSRSLTFAAVEAYLSQLPVGRHPYAALAIAIPTSEVDVNVHPAKAEVRFRDERLVGRVVRHAVAHALEGSRTVAWSLGVPGGEAFGGRAAAQLLAPLMPSRAPGGLAAVALRPPEPLQSRMAWSEGARAAPGTGPEGTSPTQREVLPMLRVVGQMGATYIVAEGPDGMYLVDQHAAHERVLFDRIVRQRTAAGAPAIQPLLEPAMLELDVAGAQTLEEYREWLEALGLTVEPFGETSYLLRAIPAGIGDTDVPAAIRALLDQLAGERRVSDPFARAAATVACHGSVRAGMALAIDEMRRLIEDLEQADLPRTCPHGRPTLVHVSTELLERQFGRR